MEPGVFFLNLEIETQTILKGTRSQKIMFNSGYTYMHTIPLPLLRSLVSPEFLICQNHVKDLTC